MVDQPYLEELLEKIIDALASLAKYKAIPKETQAQDKINAGQTGISASAPVGNPPETDWQLPQSANGIPDNQTNQLFVPSQPLPPVAPAFHAARVWDYPLAINTQVQPRAFELIKYSDLRTLADNCELVRLAIETRKGQMMKMQWNIVSRDPEKEDEDDARILDIQQRMQYPDGEHPFPTWMAMLLDQMLCFDAPTIYPHLNLDGSLNKLLIVDGTTIKRVIDMWGRTPEPTDEVPNPPAYQQIIKGVPFVNFTKDELIWWPFNPRSDHLYGFSPVEQVLYTGNMFMRRQSLQLNYFTEGVLPDFFFELPVEYTPEQIDQFATNFYDMMKGNDAARRHGKFLPSGSKVNQTKGEMLKDEFDEWLARIVCFAFSLPPTAFVKQMNRNTAEQQQDAAVEEGLAPLMIWFKQLMDYIILKYFGYDDLMFAWKEDTPIDPLVAAQANKIYLDAGTLTTNEVREQLGYDPIDDGDDAFIISGNTIVLLKDVVAGLTAPPPPMAPGDMGGPPKPPGSTPAKPATKPTDKFAKARRLKAIDRNRKAIAQRRKRMEAIAKDALKKVMATVLSQLKPHFSKLLKQDDDIDRIINDLNLKGFSVLTNPTEELLEEVHREGSASAMTQVGIEDERIVNLTNKKAIEYARERAAELVTSVTDTTRDMLRTTVTQAMEEHWTVDKLSDEIQDSAAFGEYRSTMIARTEIAKADVAGNMATYRASGVVKKKYWIKGSEHEIDDECDDNADDGEIDIDDVFSSGDDAPPAHPNCVCDVIPVLEEEEAQDEQPSDENQSEETE